MKKIISGILSVVLLASSSLITVSADDTISVDNINYENAIENQEIINSDFMGFSNSTEKIAFTVNTLTNENNKVIEYPYNYCGAYYNFEDNKMHIITTDNNTEYYEDYFSDNNYYAYDIADWTVDYLNNLQSYVDSTYCELTNYTQSNYKENKIIISVRNDNDKNKIISDLLSHDYSEDAFEVIQENISDSVKTSAYATTGRRISTDANNSPGTIGCNAYKNGVYGFVTCEHVIAGDLGRSWKVSTNSTNTSTGAGEIATSSNVSNRTRALTSKCDAAFVPFSSNAIKSTYIYNYNTATGVNQSKIIGSTTAYEGQVLTKYGVSGMYSGTVKSTSFSGNIGGTNHTDFIKMDTTVPSYGGDSGGPVGYQYTSGNYKYFVLAGFTVGAYQDFGGAALCDKWSNVSSELGISLYYGSMQPY